MAESQNTENSFISTQRLEAFSDGVFAIAITLLILEIKIPDHNALQHQSLTNYLWRLWPKYFAYIFSFIVIGIYWANHHYIFRLYKRTNHVFNLLNVFFLMTISFLPFPTAVFGEYVNEAENRHSAVTFYAVGIFLPALLWFIMWLYGSYKKRLIDDRLSRHFIQYLTRQFTLSIILYIIAIIVSLFSSVASVALSVILTLIYLLPPKKPEYS